jgi:class 3 adenylate cyclase
MSCPGCGRSNRAGARFCGGCGAALAPRCPACGATNEPDARFCDACGAALDTGATGVAPAKSPARPADDSVARKVVTIVFADLIGSTALHERLDPESVSRVMEAYHAAVRAPIEAHGGSVVQLLGDGVMCAFGVPQVAEDDALRAVRAAVAVQASFRAFLAARPELAGKVGLRVAVNTGEVVVSDDYAAGIGDPLNVAARLQQEARDGDVLVGESTRRHVREQLTLAPVGSFALKGRAEPVAAWRVISLERPAGAAAVPFVGREAELRRLQAVYDAATSGSSPAARLAVLLGSPGLGKSRLVSEFTRSLGLTATIREEAARGLDPATRVAMRRDLDEAP